MLAAIGCIVLLVATAAAYPFNPWRIRRSRTAAQQRDIVIEHLTPVIGSRGR